MPMQLTQKERMLLNDQKSHEEICIQKYNNYSNQAQDQELKQIFKKLSGKEQQHYDSINQILNGQVPNMSGNQSGNSQGNQSQGQDQNMGQQQGSNTGMANKSDATLCTDMLMTEKYVSSAYNTAIFEFRDANIRQALNHIQKEEQEHGEEIFNYMQSHGMYNAQ